MKNSRVAVLAALAMLAASCVNACANDAVRTGTVHYQPSDTEETVAERFRLPAHTFDFRERPVETSSESIEIFELTFPSAVETPAPENNTVHCEYFRPLPANRENKAPAVIVLHILGG